MTRRGRFRGIEIDAEVDAFFGIQYAEPPFGSRRFGAPVPVEHRGDCVRYGPVAPQSAELPGAPVWRPGDEAVLSFNVWARRDAEGAPVLFYLHGGAYAFGSSAQPDYDGAALARAGLVVVTCNYRLGFEGFGHVPGAPANRGLLDQRAALRRVRDTIAVFGGDPDAITVAGQSAGAASALFLAAAEPVRRVIAHSVPNRVYTEDFARRVAEWIDPTTPESAVTSADALARVQTGALGHDPVLFGPVADRLPPLDPRVDALFCHTSAEYRLFEAVGAFRPPDVDSLGRDWGVPAHVVEAYRERHPDEAAVRLAGDFVFAEPTTRLAEAHGRAHLARFTRSPGRHTADVPFCFGNLDGADFLIGGPPGDDERALSRRMLRAWVDFCATGDPGWRGVRWWGEPVEPLRAPWRGVDLDRPIDHAVTGTGARPPRRAP
ncbi:carboxylesterase family protein [Saccharothrix longispora]|uniref:carboxylesterase family protein n=1 Tax=Saccharothrix longispora TaxID=33920 RepID=UPI0028FD1BBB|nr:carboxylesterase family protein [Saccharothrix longispora]MBY8847277.1 carboxylesterase family protein [Saccharothrix sp. MB29]MDU0294897.1 carboxylesterase family protein [Saccharothrix longispora]